MPARERASAGAHDTSHVSVIDRDGIIRDFMVGAGDFSTFEKAIQPYL